MDAMKARGRVLNEEVVFVRRDGAWLSTLVTGTSVRGRDGEVLHFDGAVSDITARKRLEEQLRQAQKMEALGNLAGGIAHDFNNLLTAIGGYADLLRARLPDGSPVRHDAEAITHSVTRAASLTRQLLAYSRRQVLAPQVIHLPEVVEQLSSLLHRLIGEPIQLVTRDAAGRAFVRADRGQIEQVILNLVLNARDAMPGGGTLTLTTSVGESYEAGDSADAVEGPCVCLSVQDTGAGMDAEVRNRAFDPFFTTKEPGKGTGLGLSTVYGIVRQSGGSVWIESAPGLGTTVRVTLPRVPEPPADQASDPAVPGASATGGTLLVAEDEDAVRALIVRSLRDAGFTVLEARDGEEALEVAWRAATAIDLVVTDVVMPRLGGREMTARLATGTRRPRVLFISGYASEALDPADLTEPGTGYLQKPFTPSVLLDRVRGMLGSGATGTP
jgi:signal transduction histidine kinase/CheY-like chemotaxis protein